MEKKRKTARLRRIDELRIRTGPNRDLKTYNNLTIYPLSQYKRLLKYANDEKDEGMVINANDRLYYNKFRPITQLPIGWNYRGGVVPKTRKKRVSKKTSVKKTKVKKTTSKKPKAKKETKKKVKRSNKKVVNNVNNLPEPVKLVQINEVANDNALYQEYMQDSGY